MSDDFRITAEDKDFFIAVEAKPSEEIPVFKFALREDLKEDKRFLPTRATSKSSGWDVSCAFDDHKSLLVNPGEYLKIPLGFRCIPEKNWWFEMKPRSSTFTKKKMHALYGTVDFDYRNQCYFCCKYDGLEPITLEFGEKIGQIIPVKLQEINVEEISNEDFDKVCLTEENDRKGGFGSTSK
jgi:dUTPase